MLKPDELISKVFYAQKRRPGKNDWVKTVELDLEEIKIDLTLENMAQMKKLKFKELIKPKVKEAAFSYLQKYNQNILKL